MTYCYEHPRPALTVDCAVFGLNEDRLEVLLIQRDAEPFAGRWALPGGFVEIGESLESAAHRELREETGVETNYLEQLYTYGDPERDPRERVVSVAYVALAKLGGHRARAASDARSVAWFSPDETPDLAFDHDRILADAIRRLRSKVRYQPIGFELLPPKFTLRQLQHLYETILDRPVDKRNFRKKILAMDVLQELDEIESDVAHRAARLYRYDERRYRRLVRQGLTFEI